MAKATGEKLIVDNRRARHDYHLQDKVEAGLVLAGTEVKALRDGKATLQQAYADVRESEAWLVGLHIPEYGQGNRANHEPDRPRKLLLHRREIDRLYAQVREKGMTLVPTRLYFKDGRVKVEVALAKGKELRDKRRDVAPADVIWLHSFAVEGPDGAWGPLCEDGPDGRRQAISVAGRFSCMQVISHCCSQNYPKGVAAGSTLWNTVINSSG